jgi:Xaa-Pro aminopeptidase
MVKRWSRPGRMLLPALPYTFPAPDAFGRDCGPLRAGMVFAVEPALRVPEEKLYVGLKDVIVVRGQGSGGAHHVCACGVEGVERLTREEGMPERYARGSAT